MKSLLIPLVFAIFFAANSTFGQTGAFYIGPDACVTLKSGAKVRINGKLFIKADATGSGSLVMDTNPDTELNVTGNAEVDVYLTHDLWHIISPPISNAIINTFLNIYLRKFDETIDTAGGGIYYMNNWIYLSVPVTIPMNVMQGYSVWNQNASGKNVFVYEGTLNNGALTNTSLTNSGPGTPGGWNLVGNPYPCAIDLDAPTGWAYSNVDAAVYYWDATQYKVYISSGLGGTGSGTGSRYVPSNQGFFIKCNNTSGGSISVDNNVRVHNDASFYKSTKSLNDFLRLKVEGNNDEDEIIVHFDTNATAGYDGNFDAYKLYGLLSAPQLYTLTPDADSIMLTINVLKPDTNVTTIPLCLEVGDTGNYVITASELASFKPGTKIYLDDLLTINTVNLMQNPVYSFTANPGDDKLRFLLRFEDVGTSIKKPENEKPFYIYSAQGEIYINFSQPISNARIKVFDLLGRELYNSNKVIPGLNKIPLQLKTKSIYIITLESRNKFYSEKLFVN